MTDTLYVDLDRTLSMDALKRAIGFLPPRAYILVVPPRLEKSAKILVQHMSEEIALTLRVDMEAPEDCWYLTPHDRESSSCD